MPNDLAVGTYNVPAHPVKGGARYSLEGYVRAEGLGLEGKAWIALSCFDAEENWLGDVRSAPLTGAATITIPVESEPFTVNVVVLFGD